MIIGGILIYLYAPMFRRHWRALKQARLKATVLVVAGAIGLQIVIQIVRAVMDALQVPSTNLFDLTTTDSVYSPDLTMISSVGFALMAFAMLSPNITVFIEEIVFRYTLLEKLPIWRNALTIGLTVVVNSVVFGLIHLGNFDGDVSAIVPYMFAGLLMNLVYIWTRNAWIPALMHLLNNATLTFGALILIGVLRLFGAVYTGWLESLHLTCTPKRGSCWGIRCAGHQKEKNPHSPCSRTTICRK
ncbi:abortive infection protein [Corynebacterium suranareeae]|uniref:Abortive infection protein n=1 Tax=Corynebacterium suranareeae TaxID=2506452 RepID=A0A160PMU8_9CORY|nr:type II CAAX endopeptidase family protein [Corynebacterium suranareeae]BAU95177.1 abortive infection protein [Corynebacterium suranareeae]